MPIIGLAKMKDLSFYGVKFTPAEFAAGSVELKPEEAIARGLCPETGIALATVNVQDHITRLWPKLRSDEAVARINLLTKWEQENAKPAPAPEPVAAPQP